MKKKKKKHPSLFTQKKKIEHYNEAEGGRFTSPTNVQIRMTSPWCASCFTEVTSLYLGDPIAIQDPATQLLPIQTTATPQNRDDQSPTSIEKASRSQACLF